MTTSLPLRAPRRRRSGFLAALAFTLAWSPGCTKGGGGSGDGGGEFDVIATAPQNGQRLFLNDEVAIDFSSEVDLDSADLVSVRFAAFDAAGAALAEQPTGRFRIDTRPGDAQPGRRLVFAPTFPQADTFDDGGFRPGRSYVMQLVGGNPRNASVLRDRLGQGLNQPLTLRFTTATGTTPQQLFRNPGPGGPRRRGFAITPPPGPDGVPLNLFGLPRVELRLAFDQPLNPQRRNVPVGLDTDPLRRSSGERGSIFLDYLDPGSGQREWIPADVELETNAPSGAVVVLRPIGVLPNNADVRVVVGSELQDLSGESNESRANYDEVFATFRTSSSYAPQFDAIVEDFRGASAIDFDAPLLEPQAEVGVGMLRAGFDFEGVSTRLEFDPSPPETVLNTDTTTVVPSNGLPFLQSGGVFTFARVDIRPGHIVRGEGTRPMVWLVHGEFRVGGTLTVGGGDGDRVNSLGTGAFPTSGGIGRCGGGRGGVGSPGTTDRSPRGENGAGSRQRPGLGGAGGFLGCPAACLRGSGGGGGSFATQGDPFFKVRAVGTTFQQQVGVGGLGCSNRSLAGGAAGPSSFTDPRADNDFWGTGVDLARRLRIRGELSQPQGGTGGGGGGNAADACGSDRVGWFNDRKGGGGGAGGGILIVKALGRIVVEATGRIDADGGNGGGGAQAGSSNQGGGGGGGSGGMVVLMSATGIEVHARSTNGTAWTYGENDYRFAVSADGGIGRRGSFGTTQIDGKYPPRATANEYDTTPIGGFGGMGIVQLMAPPGDPGLPSSDGTNTVLDDNIEMWQGGVRTSGVRKMQLLAWRGFAPTASAPAVDDLGNPTNIGANEGEIRPAPILLPVPFGARSRARSRWIDLGAVRRRAIAAPDGLPRGLVEDEAHGLRRGPTFEFAGVVDQAGAIDDGFLKVLQRNGAIEIDAPAVLSVPAQIAAATSGAEIGGAPAHRVVLADAVLGPVPDRYRQHEAELLNESGTTVGAFAILGHDDRELLLAAASGPLPAQATQLQVRRRFASVRTAGAPGLGPTYTGISGELVPVANVRIGFAFHRDPTAATAVGPDPGRYPADPDQYAHDLEDPAVQEVIRQLGAGFVQWDVTFDMTFRARAGDLPPALSASSPRPELRFLRLPFHF